MFHSLYMSKALTQEMWDCRLWCRRLLAVSAVASSTRQRCEDMLSSLAPACGVTSNAALGSYQEALLCLVTSARTSAVIKRGTQAFCCEV